MIDSSARAIVVRRATAAEWAPLRELRLGALRTDPWAFGARREVEEGYDDERWRERANQGASSATSSQWVAERSSGELVGSAVVAEVEGEVHVFAMWVAPDLRGQGIGGRLLDAGLAWAARTFPGRPVRLEVNPRQAAAVRLYEARGFRANGRSRPLEHIPGDRVIEMVREPS